MVEDVAIDDVEIDDVPVDEVPGDETPGDEQVDALDDLDAGDVAERRRARDEVVGPATEGLMRRAKRILQDDQNEFLDAMRRQKAKVDPARLLPGLELQVAVWAEVLSPAVDTVYRAGREAVAPGARSAAAPEASRERPRRGAGGAAA